jgi:uncharacterized protein (TIGR03067 family)
VWLLALLLVGQVNGDISRLVGEWRYVAMTVKGKQTDPTEVRNYRLVIAKHGAVSIFDGDRPVVTGRITKVELEKKPMQIDCVLAGRSAFDGRFAPEHAQEGIFEVTRDGLKMCRSRDAKAESRPTEFRSPADKDLVLEEFERIK